MNQVLVNLLSQVESLNSLDELFILQERINTRIRTIVIPNGEHNGSGHMYPQVTSESPKETETSGRRMHIPGTYQRSQEEISALSARLRGRLSPPEQEKFDKIDLSKVDFGGKSMSQMLIEERQEERY